MGGLHFFERIERENDYYKEYVKLEKLCAERYINDFFGNKISINAWIEDNFRNWKRRDNFISYEELREYLEFNPRKEHNDLYNTETWIDLNRYVLFCEMILNLINGLKQFAESGLTEAIDILTDTIKKTISKAGLEFKQVEDEIIIVERNSYATEVATKEEDKANVIIEYNQYLLKGNIERKKQLLRNIADDLEPKRSILKSICRKAADNFFCLVNTMNIRHNNCNANDKSNYNPIFANMTAEEQEECYDLIYEQALFLYINLEQQVINKKIEQYKNA